MAYRFEGVFVECPSLNAKELEELFDGFARDIEQPSVGTVVSFNHNKEQISVKSYVLEKSKRLSDSKIAYIEYSNCGWTTEYAVGFACRNGIIMEGSEQEKEDDLQNEVLISLLQIMGAEPVNGNFEPFERGSFPNT
jgi:hypothetical protein